MTTLEHLSRYYSQQLSSYRTLAALTEKLLKLTENVEMSAEEIGRLISRRQIIIDTITEQEKTAEPLWLVLQKQLGFKPEAQLLPELYPAAAEAKEIAKSHREIQTILKQIVASDALIRETLATACHKLQKKLCELQKKRQASEIYKTTHSNNKGVFLDSKKN
ncbi:MAG: hypothetical protein GX922_01850 [Firmicutes bacterium]|nr:hypothetical protein [Bacillota bacterium]